jgi:hypothetical protein
MRRRALFWIPVVILTGLIIFLFCRVLLPGGRAAPGNLLDSLLNFRCKATISYNGMKAEADVVRSLDGSTRVTLNSPEALQGLQFDFSENGVSLNFKGLKLDVEPSSFLASSMASALVNAVDTALQEENLNLKERDGKTEISSKSGSGNFVLCLDSKTGVPLSLTVPSLGLDCVFSDYVKGDS